MRRQALDTRLLGVLREELLAPPALAELQAEVRQLLAEHGQAGRRAQDGAQGRLQALQGEIGRLADAVAQLGLSEALRARLAAAEAERDELVERLRAAPPAAPAAIPDVVARYRRQVLDLQRALTEGPDADLARTREILAAALGTVVVGRDQETGEDYAELEEPAERRLLAAVGESLGLVAGARNTTTRRLTIAGHRRRGKAKT